MAQNSGRQTLLRRVQMYEFAVVEAGMFLDSHPENQQALNYHNKYSQLLRDAKAEYCKRFGPLEQSTGEKLDRWNWVDDPWPWDPAANSDIEEGE
jgi:spore coat protein JB